MEMSCHGQQTAQRSALTMFKVITSVNTTNGIIYVIDGVMNPNEEAAAATASGGFLGLPGFEGAYALAALAAVACLTIRLRKHGV